MDESNKTEDIDNKSLGPQTFWTDVDGYSRRRSSRARLSLYDIHARTDQLPTPEAHIGTLSLTNVITGLYFE